MQMPWRNCDFDVTSHGAAEDFGELYQRYYFLWQKLASSKCMKMPTRRSLNRLRFFQISTQCGVTGGIWFVRLGHAYLFREAAETEAYSFQQLCEHQSDCRFLQLVAGRGYRSSERGETSGHGPECCLEERFLAACWSWTACGFKGIATAKASLCCGSCGIWVINFQKQEEIRNEGPVRVCTEGDLLWGDFDGATHREQAWQAGPKLTRFEHEWMIHDRIISCVFYRASSLFIPPRRPFHYITIAERLPLQVVWCGRLCESNTASGLKRVRWFWRSKPPRRTTVDPTTTCGSLAWFTATPLIGSDSFNIFQNIFQNLYKKMMVATLKHWSCSYGYVWVNCSSQLSPNRSKQPNGSLRNKLTRFQSWSSIRDSGLWRHEHVRPCTFATLLKWFRMIQRIFEKDALCFPSACAMRDFHNRAD